MRQRLPWMTAARMFVSPWSAQCAFTSAAGPVQASWTSQSEVLLPGNLQSGERVLVFDGAIDSDLLRDTLTITLRADGNRVLRPEILNFTFEIDIP